MPKKPQPIPTDKIPDIAAAMRVKAKNPVTVTPEGLVKSLTKPIQEMLDAGYTYEHVRTLLLEHGVELSARNIQRFHRQHLPAQAKPAPAPHLPESSEPAEQSIPKKAPKKQREKTSKPTSKRTQSAKKNEVKPPQESPANTPPASSFNITDRTNL